MDIETDSSVCVHHVIDYYFSLLLLFIVPEANDKRAALSEQHTIAIVKSRQQYLHRICRYYTNYSNKLKYNMQEH